MENNYKAARDITLIGSAANILLAAIKIAAGVLGRSAALVADGMHSISDLVSDAVILIGIKVSMRPVDSSHPFGHGKFEALSTAGTSIILAIVGFGIIYEAAITIMSGVKHLSPAPITIVVAFISIISKEWLFQVTNKLGKKLNSSSVIANALHHRSDAASSLVVLFGITVSFLGLWYADSAAAIIVGIVIIYEAYKINTSAIGELTDAEMMPTYTLNKIKKSVADIPGIVSVNSVITHKYGPNYIIDISVAVGAISIEISADLSAIINRELKSQFEHIKRVNVYFEASCDLHDIDNKKQDILAKRLIDISKSFKDIMGLHNYLFLYNESGVIASVDIEVPGDITTEESHRIGKSFKSAAMEEDKEIKDLIVHIDPYHPETKLTNVIWRKCDQ